MPGVAGVANHVDQSEAVGLRCSDTVRTQTQRGRRDSLPSPDHELRWMGLAVLVAVTSALVVLPFLLLHGDVDD